MSGQDQDRARLKALEERIRAVKGEPAPDAPQQGMSYSTAEAAWRMVIELVAGLLIGGGIGWGLDALLGTQPVFLVLFILLGFAAGVNVMLRTAKSLTTPPEAEDEAAQLAPKDEDAR